MGYRSPSSASHCRHGQASRAVCREGGTGRIPHLEQPRPPVVGRQPTSNAQTSSSPNSTASIGLRGSRNSSPLLVAEDADDLGVRLRVAADSATARKAVKVTAAESRDPCEPSPVRRVLWSAEPDRMKGPGAVRPRQPGRPGRLTPQRVLEPTGRTVTSRSNRRTGAERARSRAPRSRSRRGSVPAA